MNPILDYADIFVVSPIFTNTFAYNFKKLEIAHIYVSGKMEI